jgi:hypothetical protein
MANGRAITGQLSLGLPKPEIPTQVGLAGDRIRTDPDRIESILCRFTSEMARSRTNIMKLGPNEGSMPTDCPDGLYELTRCFPIAAY